MSILNKLRQLCRRLLSPPLSHPCAICGERLKSNERYICLRCMCSSPITGFINDPTNAMTQRARDLIPAIEHASALLLYSQGSPWSRTIRSLKYHGEIHHGELLGEWLGIELSGSRLYKDIDSIVAIPLHPLKAISRGYNQSDLIAHAVAKELGCKVIRGAVTRRRNNSPQVSLNREQRWGNAENLFRVKEPKRLEGRNILLIDDVFTTGATILSCAEEILSSVANCRIWIATIAVSKRELGVGEHRV